MINTPTVFVSGIFNIVHPGHLRLLRFAKEIGGRLIVGVESDRIAGNSGHVPEELRLDGLRIISLVDEVMIVDEPIEDFILRLRPDFVVKGREHEVASNIEASAVQSYGGKLIFSSGEAIFSSLDLIKKEFQEPDLKTIFLPLDFMNRHKIDSACLALILNNFSSLKVCVVGDLIVDEYISCQPLGMSQEDPSIVVAPIESQRFLGGAGIVAAHAAGLGAKVEFITITGNDSIREFALSSLSDAGVNSHLLVDSSRPTTLKQRYRSGGRSLFRVSHLHQGGISMQLQEEIYSLVRHTIEGTDLLVFSDFNYGCLPQALVENLITLAKHKGVMVVADSQSSSQTGDIGRFKGMNLITPTEREARISTRNHEDGLVVLAEQIRQQASPHNVLLKLGEEGLLVHAGNRQASDWLTDRIPALNSAPKDVAGAGDSLLITAAMTLASGGSIWEAACLGSLAAGLQVSRVGNIPLRLDELILELRA